MLFRTKREYYRYKYRMRIVQVFCAVIGLGTGLIGNGCATFEKIDGVVSCSEVFDIIWKCAVFPFAVILLTVFVRKARGTVAAVMGTKIAVTVIGLIFGINTNISLYLFRDDWGVLFFLAVDVFIIYAVYNATDAKLCVMSAISLVLFAMIISHIIMKIEGGFTEGYLFRMIYLMMFYCPVWYVVHCTTRRMMTVPDPDEWARIKARGECKDD